MISTWTSSFIKARAGVPGLEIASAFNKSQIPDSQSAEPLQGILTAIPVGKRWRIKALSARGEVVMRLNSVARIARNCTASMRFKGGSACLNLNSVIDGLAASQKTTRSEAEARPHCKLARISPADRLDPHLNFVTPISPVSANSRCQILRAFPGKLHGLYCTHHTLLRTQAPGMSGRGQGFPFRTLDAD